MALSVQRRGGAQVGWLSASWPLATLHVSAHTLSISVVLAGSYSFAQEDVVALEPLTGIFSRGIRVRHARHEYPDKVVFAIIGNPEAVLEEIRGVGFQPRGRMVPEMAKRQIPLRWEVIVAAVVAWNALFLLDGFVPWREPKPPGPFVLVALAAVFLSALAVSLFTRAQSWVLRPDRYVTEIKPFLRLLLIVSGFLLLMFLADP